MDNGDDVPLTIGQLARRTGLPVRTIRYWSDIGAVPPAGRTDGGHRVYDAEAVARLDLVRTLRELGLGLEDVRRVLGREATVAEVAAAHVAALDAQIRSLRLARAVLSAVARLQPGTKEMTIMNKLARLSSAERARIIDDFIEETFDGLSPDPRLKDKLRLADLPDEPTPEQVAAWVELAELVGDPEFRRRMRAMVEYHAESHDQESAAGGINRKVAELVSPARAHGVAPDSPEATRIVEQVTGGAGPERRARIRERVKAGAASQADRYHELLAVLNGQQSRPSRAADLEWLLAALDSHSA